MRAFFLISALVHMALLLAVAIPYQRQTAHGEPMSVELVPPSEAPVFNEDPTPPDQQPPQLDKPKREEQTPDFSQLRIDPVPRDKQNQPQQQPAQRQQQ